MDDKRVRHEHLFDLAPLLIALVVVALILIFWG
jgi:hypothetical protein